MITEERVVYAFAPDVPSSDELVRRIVTALDHRPHGAVEVAGDPRLAEGLRRTLGSRVTTDEVTAPIAVVDATGSPHVIRGALRRLADNGVLVLLAELHGDCGQLDYYEDLHLRGLTVMGL